ncbi:MAG: TRAP transporter substrate-binding protein DctP [Deltaproteobacteria bacterium]|nr:TRAP transporter substrate-binding protein DctP [Deltaproteobacteria bacterium]
MKIRRFIGLAGMILAGVCVIAMAGMALPGTAQAAEKVIKWRCQTFEPPTETWMAKETMASIEKASGGRLKIDVFAGGELVPSPEILKSVSGGMIEMGMGFGGYWPARVDVANLESGLPMSWSDLQEAFDVYFCRGLLEVVREGYKESGVMWWPKFASLYNLISTKPVKSLADMKKMKIRVAGPTALLLKSVGVATTFLPFEEVYMGLATGTIDGAIMGPLHTYKNMKMQEVAKYYIDFAFMLPVVNVMVNQKAFDALSPDLKEIVDLAMFRNTFRVHRTHISEEYKIRKELVKQGKLTITSMDPASIKELRKAAVPVWEAEAKKSPRAAKAIELIMQMMKDRGKLD